MTNGVKINLGPVSAYALAKKHGFQGTEEEWATLQAQAGTNSAEAKEAREQAQNAALQAQDSEKNAADSENNAHADSGKAQQAMTDLLAMMGTDVATLVGGKLPMSQIPATATQEIYAVASESELTNLTAQRGDLAELVEEIGGEQTITKTWQCLGNASVRENWVIWGTSYAVRAGSASTATNAENANAINGHRIVEMTEEQYQQAVKDPETYYLVYVPQAEVHI